LFKRYAVKGGKKINAIFFENNFSATSTKYNYYTKAWRIFKMLKYFIIIKNIIMKKISTVALFALMVNFCKANIVPEKIGTTFNFEQFKKHSSLNEVIRVIFQNNSGKKGIMKFKLTIENPDGAKRVEELAISGDASIRKDLNLEIGCKVYVDNGYKLNTLIGGKIPAKDGPFMTVMARDKNQTINLVEETNAAEAVVLANAAKSAEKLKITSDAKIDYVVTGNIVTVTYKAGNGSTLAEFDCDKKNGNVKNINDLRKKQDDQGPAGKSGVNKAKGMLGK
jgi:hypothetical protein